jgi:hypothetical protein
LKEFLKRMKKSFSEQKNEKNGSRTLSVTISGFYENEELESIKSFFEFSNLQGAVQKGYSESLGYSIRKR